MTALPSDWETRRIGDVAQIALAPRKRQTRERGSYFIIDMGSVDRFGNLLTHKTTDVSENMLLAGDLVMPKDDIGGGQIIGKCVLVDADGKYVQGDHVYRIRLKCGIPAFVRYAINSADVNESLRSKVVGSAQLGLGRRSVEEQSIPWPSEDEQERIARALSEVDDLIDALDVLLSKKAQVSAGVARKLFLGDRRLPGFNDPWGEHSFADVLTLLNTSESQLDASEYQSSGRTIVVDQGKQAVAGYSDRTDLVVLDGSIEGHIVFGDHTCAIKFVDEPFLVGADGVKVLLTKEGFDPQCVAYGLKTFPLVSTGYNRHYSSLTERTFWLPGLPEQRAIAEVLSDSDAEILSLQRLRDKYVMIKNGMMDELLTGRTRLT